MDKLSLTNWTDRQAKKVLQIVNDIVKEIETKDKSLGNSFNNAKEVSSIETNFNFDPGAYV